jgi:hypothetical protein
MYLAFRSSVMLIYFQLLGNILEMCTDRGTIKSVYKHMLHLHGSRCYACVESEAC